MELRMQTLEHVEKLPDNEINSVLGLVQGGGGNHI